jgi:glycosyltransferase involved in cell wall biosynthesis
MDADDISHPLRIEKQVKFLNAHPEYAMIGSSYYVIDNSGKTISHVTVLTEPDAIKKGLETQNWFGHGTVMMKKSVLDSNGAYDELFVYAQDYDLWLRFSEKYVIGNIEEPLYFWRDTKDAISRKKVTEQQACAQLAQKKHRERINQTQPYIAIEIKEQSPMVSVIVPTFNRPEMLAQAINSIKQQSFSNFEIVVVNDAGKPVEQGLDQIDCSGRITYIKHSCNRGLAAARNSGIRLARGKYIAYLDDDDLFYNDHLENLVKFLETTKYKVAYTDACRAHQVMQSGKYVVSKRDVPYSIDFDYDLILCTNYVPVLCFMHEKSCLDDVGGFDETFNRYEDWDLWIRLSQKYKIAHIKKVTCEFSWRKDGTSMTSGNQNEFHKMYDQICSKYYEISKNKPSVLTSQRRMKMSFHLAEASDFLKHHNSNEAIKTLEKSLKIDSSNIHVLNMLQKLHKESGNYDKAEIFRGLANTCDSTEMVERFPPPKK